ncbi:MAG: hypothetical protein CMJ36_06250 [Phycisphaerae bacterium]|nr:hypothetical protein [Phycisphaerae bacterium]
MEGVESLALAIESTEGLLLRFLEDVPDDVRVTQAAGLPNHFIWTLGHCAMTMHKLASKIDGVSLPADDFSDGAGRDPERFDAQAVCKGSTPETDAGHYPSMERGRAIYSNACRRLASTVRGIDPGELNSTRDWNGTSIPVIDLVLRVCFHNGVHAGQVLDLRRALGMPRIIG